MSFFFQAEDGIRDSSVTGVQTCALPISYCPPCRVEMPLLASRVGAQASVQLVLIDEGDNAESARGFLSSVGVHQPALLDSDLCVGRAYGAIGLPITVFVRVDGSIDARQVGQLDDRTLVAELSKLVGQ